MLNVRINNPIKVNRGIALIQVLIISIILTMLGIYINQTVRSQIGVVGLMKNSFSLHLKLENTEAELIHSLLTEKRYQSAQSESSLVQRWNFHGRPFLLQQDTLVTIQDLSGVLSLNALDHTIARNLFAKLGKSDHEVRTFLDSVADWKDKDDLKRLNGAESDDYRYIMKPGPRNAFLQSLGEVENIVQGQLLTPAQWQSYFTEEVTSNFNPLNAPELILKAFINNDAAYEEVLEQRNSGSLTAYSFYQATSIEENEFVLFVTGKKLKVTLSVKGHNNKLSKQFIVDLRPRSSSRPIVISQLTWNQV